MLENLPDLEGIKPTIFLGSGPFLWGDGSRTNYSRTNKEHRPFPTKFHLLVVPKTPA